MIESPEKWKSPGDQGTDCASLGSDEYLFGSPSWRDGELVFAFPFVCLLRASFILLVSITCVATWGSKYVRN